LYSESLHNDSELTVTNGLADQLKAATWPNHRRAEKTGVIQAILKQTITRRQYWNYLSGLYFIYETLENYLSSVKLPQSLVFLSDERHFRKTSIEADLNALRVGHDNSERMRSKAVETYCRYIETHAQQSDAAIAGLAYVRYLGDMNGGQILKTCLKKSIGLSDEALNFYSFPDLENLIKYRRDFRESLNALSLIERDRLRVIDVARNSFEMNIALSIEICEL